MNRTSTEILSYASLDFSIRNRDLILYRGNRYEKSLQISGDSDYQLEDCMYQIRSLSLKLIRRDVSRLEVGPDFSIKIISQHSDIFTLTEMDDPYQLETRFFSNALSSPNSCSSSSGVRPLIIRKCIIKVADALHRNLAVYTKCLGLLFLFYTLSTCLE